MIRRAALLGVVGLVACGGSDGDEPVATEPAVTEPVVTETITTADTVVVAMDVDPCSLVTGDDVVDAFGLRVVATESSAAHVCELDLGTDAGESIFVSIEDGEGRMSGAKFVYDEYVLLLPDEAERVDGVGEDAVYAPDFRGIAVDAGGGQYVAIGVNGGFGDLAEPRDGLIALAGVAVERL